MEGAQHHGQLKDAAKSDIPWSKKIGKKAMCGKAICLE
jgi:hypothetical protein